MRERKIKEGCRGRAGFEGEGREEGEQEAGLGKKICLTIEYRIRKVIDT